jgi:hypothetical protein
VKDCERSPLSAQTQLTQFKRHSRCTQGPMRAAVASWKPNSRPATAPRRRICEAIGGWLAQAGLRDGTMRWGHLLCARRIYCLVSAESALLPWGETLPRRESFLSAAR